MPREGHIFFEKVTFFVTSEEEGDEAHPLFAEDLELWPYRKIDDSS
jgi:hypothetical protein